MTCIPTRSSEYGPCRFLQGSKYPHYSCSGQWLHADVSVACVALCKFEHDSFSLYVKEGKVIVCTIDVQLTFLWHAGGNLLKGI